MPGDPRLLLPLLIAHSTLHVTSTVTWHYSPRHNHDDCSIIPYSIHDGEGDEEVLARAACERGKMRNRRPVAGFLVRWTTARRWVHRDLLRPSEQ